jgi:hypothetical protein
MTTTAKNEMTDIKEIAKCVRADIKAAIAAGKLPAFKVSVSISRFSGGHSLSVYVKGVPAGYAVLNAKNVAWSQENRHLCAHFHAPEDCRNRNSDEAVAHTKVLEQIVGQYNWDDSDIQSDYFHVNFYAHVGFHWELERTERESLERAAA